MTNIAPRTRYLRIDGHEIHLTEWGEEGRPARGLSC